MVCWGIFRLFSCLCFSPTWAGKYGHLSTPPPGQSLLSSKFPLVDHHSTHPPYYQPTCLPVAFLQSSVFGLSVCPPPFLRHSSRHILTPTGQELPYSVKDLKTHGFQGLLPAHDILSVNWVGSKVLIRAGIRLGCLPREHLILLIRAVELGFCNDRHRSSKEPLAALPR